MASSMSRFFTLVVIRYMAINLEVLQSRHAANYPTSGVSFHTALILDQRSYFVITADSATDIITATGHNFISGTPVQFSGATLPAPLLSTGTYYVRDVTANTFKVALGVGLTAIDLTTNGSGTLTVTDVELTSKVGGLDQWIRKEIASYQGATQRQSYVPVAPTIDWTNDLVKFEVTVFFDNTGGASSIVYDKALIIRAGAATRGDTTGTFDMFFKFPAIQSIAAGERRGIKIPNILANG